MLYAFAHRLTRANIEVSNPSLTPRVPGDASRGGFEQHIRWIDEGGEAV